MARIDGTHHGFGQKAREAAQKKSEKTGKPIGPDKLYHEGDLVNSFGDKRIQSDVRGKGAATQGTKWHKESDRA